MEHDGLYVQTCWIAHVKELNGLTFRPAPNRRFLEKPLQPCPEHVRPKIEASLRRFNMLCTEEAETPA